MLVRSDNAQSQRGGELLGRIANILDGARNRVVRTVNHATVSAYWHIGREIVEALQQGDERADYGKSLIEQLAKQLTSRYGRGFSATNLGYFRQFYLAFRDRLPSSSSLDSPFTLRPDLIPHTVCGELRAGFHANLTWSHYRALMRVTDGAARRFYETEAAHANWSCRDLARQISTLFYQRRLARNDDSDPVQAEEPTEQVLRAIDVLKDPYVLEFLDIPAPQRLRESQLEDAIITRLQQFLLELGRGFSFMARQQRVRLGDQDFYIDLVFYNYLLRCAVLVDLKLGELSYQDIGQMDGYVRLYEAQHRPKGDNPTIGLILCSEQNAAIARYSVLHESQQLFASSYRFTLPSEEELQWELRRERALIEEQMVADRD